MKISIDHEFSCKLPEFKVFYLFAEIKNSAQNDELWGEINFACKEFRSQFSFESYKLIPAIVQARAAYKKLGKDPSRYRLSSEALVKRILDKKELYRVNTVVDIINLVSVRYFHSIGLFDADKIQGDVQIRVGAEGETYNSHGKAAMNIANLPVYADNLGAFGSTTTDSLRTLVDVDTKRILMAVNCFEGGNISEEMDYAKKLLRKYVDAVIYFP